MALWIRCQGVQPEQWLEQARRLGIEFQLGKDLAMRPCVDDYVRLGFASVTPHEMNDAIARLATAWRRAGRSRK
jgi:DNA-binding transcriptional MocR family regulator